jgi:hypothetical protein
MRLVAPLVVVDYSASRRLVVDYSASPRLVIDYSVRRDFVLRPRWLYFSHAVRGDYLSRGNAGSTSSAPHAATTSSSSVASLEAMFPEHWERGTGTWNVILLNHGTKGVYLFRKFQFEMEHVPSVMGTMFPERCFGTRNVHNIKMLLTTKIC